MGGPWGTTPEKFEGIKWQTALPKYLGVPLEASAKPNQLWRDVANKVRKQTFTWRQRELSIFQRAECCNIFLVSRILYLLQSVSCARKSIHVLHRIFATFIWCSKFEPIRRENLFKSIKEGGVGLHHIFVTKLIMRLFFLRTARHPILRTMIQSVGGAHLPGITVSVESVVGHVRGFYREVVECMNFLQTRFSVEYLFQVRRKKLAMDLVDVLFPEPIYRKVPNGWHGKDVLTRVLKMPIRAAIKTFVFRLYMGVPYQ